MAADEANFQRALEEIQRNTREIEEELEAELLAQTQLCDEIQQRLNESEDQNRQLKMKLIESQTETQAITSRYEDIEEKLRIAERSLANALEENHVLLERLALHETDLASNTHT